MADQNQTPSPPQNLTGEIGASGTYFFKGYITAEEYTIDLQGKYGLQVYDVMRKSDATVRAALSICKNPIQGADWMLESPSEDPADVKMTELANYEFFKRKFNYYDTMREGFTFLDFGFYTGELVFEPATYQGTNYIGLSKIGFRKQRSILKWELDSGKPGVSQQLPSGGSAEIPREKLLVVVNEREGENYFGVSLLRYAYKPWKIKDALEIMNAIALEKQGLGIPYIKKNINGVNTTEEELTKARDMLRQQRANEEGFWEFPESVEIGLTDMKGQTTKDIIPTIEYQDRQILLSVLGQFLLLGSADSAGSRAVSQDHSRLFVKAIESVAKQWQEAFQRDVIDKWAAMNFSKLPNGAPKLVYGTLSDEDVKETSDAVAALVTSGALSPDIGIENRLRKMLNMPEMDEAAYEDQEEQAEADKANAAQKDNENIDEVNNKAKPATPGQAQPAGKQKPTNQKQQAALREARIAQKRLFDALR